MASSTSYYGKSDSVHVNSTATGVDFSTSSGPVGQRGSVSAASNDHGVPEIVSSEDSSREIQQTEEEPRSALQRLRSTPKSWLAYIKTRDFWIVLALGQVLSLCLTATNTLTELLAIKGTSIPAFQTLLNYAFLNAIYTSYTIYKYGFKKWLRLLYKDGWRYFILAFMDVQGNYFTVLAYDYTTILSAQLIDFFAIVVVVIVSFIFLRVRYHFTQYLGILICIGGMGILLTSDHITGSNGGHAANALKGDLFAVGGAAFYGLSNVFEEFLVSKRPLYEVIGQLAFWATFIDGVQTAIFDRGNFHHATWDGQVGGYFVGYTLILSLFYSLAPLMFRLGSAAFFNISLLTSDFWGVAIGTSVFGLTMYYLYPIAFVCIIIGLLFYFLTESILGDAHKPWLGEHQEGGIDGLGTARRKVERAREAHQAVGERIGGAREVEQVV